MDDPDAQVKLSAHLADETRHAWLWTKRINDMGGEPMKIADGYQKRVGRRTVPRSILEILALTVVVEERSFASYIEFAEHHQPDAATLEVLKDITGDEKWHMSWIRSKLVEIARQEGDESLAEKAIEKYPAHRRRSSVLGRHSSKGVALLQEGYNSFRPFPGRQIHSIPFLIESFTY